MPGFFMHVGTTMMCPHGGQIVVPPSHGVTPPRVLLNFPAAQVPVAVMNPPIPVATCTANPKCTNVQWTMASTRVFAMGRPVMLQTAPAAPGGGLCDSAPPAPPLDVRLQSVKVVAM
jgi:hypothetical protein